MPVQSPQRSRAIALVYRYFGSERALFIDEIKVRAADFTGLYPDHLGKLKLTRFADQLVVRLYHRLPEVRKMLSHNTPSLINFAQTDVFHWGTKLALNNTISGEPWENGRNHDEGRVIRATFIHEIPPDIFKRIERLKEAAPFSVFEWLEIIAIGLLYQKTNGFCVGVISSQEHREKERIIKAAADILRGFEDAAALTEKFISDTLTFQKPSEADTMAYQQGFRELVERIGCEVEAARRDGPTVEQAPLQIRKDL